MADCNQSNISNHFSSTLATSRQVFGQHGQLINEPREGFFVLTFSYIRLFSWFMDVTLWLLIAQDCKSKCFWPRLGKAYQGKLSQLKAPLLLPLPPSRLTESVPKAELQVNTRQQRLRQKTQRTKHDLQFVTSGVQVMFSADWLLSMIPSWISSFEKNQSIGSNKEVWHLRLQSLYIFNGKVWECKWWDLPALSRSSKCEFIKNFIVASFLTHFL